MKKMSEKIKLFVAFSVIAFMSQNQVIAAPQQAVSEVRVMQHEKLVEIYRNKMPKWLKVNLKYTYNLPKYLEYVYIKSVDGTVRVKPASDSQGIEKYPYNTKLKLIEKMENQYGNVWYKVQTPSGKVGYISDRIVEERRFRFDVMMGKVKELEEFIVAEKGKGREIYTVNSYVPNPNNVNFKREKDKYGVTLDQNILGYYSGGSLVVPDKSILSITEDKGDKAVVNVASIKDGPLTVEKRYLTSSQRISENFRKVIAIDIENQNFGVFEKINGEWTLISYVYTKTGMESQVGFETPRGFFVVPMLKYEMGYRSEIGENQGYAKYAMRFSGGGYLHGTPLNYEEEMNRAYFLEQKEFTLGTVPGTRKCIRTSEEHARFLFNWILAGNQNSRTNEQYPSESVMVVIF